MRVITGTARGIKLYTPEGNEVRPTIDRVKEGVFNALQFEIEGRRVLDLFAGSGQMGIEALSRGAKCCTFVDNSERSLDAVRRNLEKTRLGGNARVERSDAAAFVACTDEVYDIAFLDPPYMCGIYDKVLDGLVPKMADGGVILCEHSAEVALEERYADFAVCGEYKYGKVYVGVYRKER